MPPPNLPGTMANMVVLHFCSDVRVSKNVKELSFNSFFNAHQNPALPIIYFTLKNIIDTQYQLMGQLLPDSVTFLSSHTTQ
jgi:hypothetical protein